MSKSKKNVVDPNDIISSYGADTARWFMLSDSPPDRDLEWTETGISSSYKFINKIWELLNKYKNYNVKLDEVDLSIDEFKQKINEVSKYIEDFQFNKSVAKIYEYVNLLISLTNDEKINSDTFELLLKKLCLILQPFLPHISEEIWSNLNNSDLCINQKWPIEEISNIKTKIKIAIQINGKTRNVLEINNSDKQEDIINTVKKNDKINKYLLSKTIVKEIYVPNKIINFVIK